MHVLVTGAAGFIGQELAVALLNAPDIAAITLTDVVQPSAPLVLHARSVSIDCLAVDLTNAKQRSSLFQSEAFDCIYLLHGIMSGAAEANLNLGLEVNLKSQIAILELLRDTGSGSTKVIYASVGAVYGPTQKGDLVSEKTVPTPQSSYGAQKLMVETLINDFSRRNLIDGRICRLPTVTIRAGTPTGAASSFASAMFREPLNGKRTTLPVSRDQEMCICSPRTVIKNLVHASTISKERFGISRTVLLPGIKVTVQQMLDALKQVGGKKALDLVNEQIDEAINVIVASWPADFDTARAESLGFEPDVPLLENVQEYYRRYVFSNRLPSR